MKRGRRTLPWTSTSAWSVPEMDADRVIVSDAEAAGIAFSADGASLAAICRDAKLRLWNVRTGALERTVAWEKDDTSVSLSPGAGLLGAVGKDGSVKLW